MSNKYKTGYSAVGVGWNKYCEKWVAYIRDNNGKKRHLGYFTDKEDAIEAKAKAEYKSFGEAADFEHDAAVEMFGGGFEDLGDLGEK